LLEIQCDEVAPVLLCDGMHYIDDMLIYLGPSVIREHLTHALIYVERVVQVLEGILTEYLEECHGHPLEVEEIVSVGGKILPQFVHVGLELCLVELEVHVLDDGVHPDSELGRRHSHINLREHGLSDGYVVAQGVYDIDVEGLVKGEGG
jgi:hypothetical protein